MGCELIDSRLIVNVCASGRSKAWRRSCTGGTFVGQDFRSAGAWWGGFWGLLFGLLFFIPFAGLALGAGMGALHGIKHKNAKEAVEGAAEAALAAYLMEAGRGHELQLPKGAKLEIELERALYLVKE